MTIQSVRGIHDILPSDNFYWHFVESTLTQLLAQYSYQQIRLPIIEKTELFKRAIGDVTDIVEKEMYSFIDQNDDQLSLRPEGTASCVRACVQHGLLYNQVQKLWYKGEMFRRERPQKGRYRQFNQLGVEIFGLANADSDAELILLSHQMWQNLKLTDIQLELNSIGSKEARQSYCQKLISYLEPYKNDLDSDSQRRLNKNPLRILDTKNPQTVAILEDAPVLADCLSADDQAYFARLIQLLEDLKIDYALNPRLVRGLDYYSQTVFEWTASQLGAKSTICAGGRYDDLIGLLATKPGTAVGFAVGIERLVELVKAQQILDSKIEQVADIYIAITSKPLINKALLLAQKLRCHFNCMRVRQGSASMSLKSQLKQANKFNARYALILGEDQAMTQILCKDLQGTHEQQMLDTVHTISFLERQYEY